MTRTALFACLVATMSCSACSTPGDPDMGPVDLGGDVTTIPPTLELGGGDLGFTPMVDGQDAGLVMGCQGGFHVWTGVRARGLDPRSPIVDLTMTRVRDGVPISMIFHVRSTLTQVGTSDVYEGYGYRLQVTSRDDALNEDVLIRATVTDRGGASATDMRMVHVVDGGSACTTFDGSIDGLVPRGDMDVPDADLPGDAGVDDMSAAD